MTKLDVVQASADDNNNNDQQSNGTDWQLAKEALQSCAAAGYWLTLHNLDKEVRMDDSYPPDDSIQSQLYAWYWCAMELFQILKELGMPAETVKQVEEHWTIGITKEDIIRNLSEGTKKARLQKIKRIQSYERLQN